MFTRRHPRGISAGFLLAGLALFLPGSLTAAGFLENEGQVDAAVRYYGAIPGATVYLTPEALVLDLKEFAPQFGEGTVPPVEVLQPGAACAVYIRFENATTPVMEVRRQLPGATNFFLGKDPAEWRGGVRSFGEVVYRDLWPGIDLVYRLGREGLEYEAVVQPGADPGQIRFRVEGADNVLQTAEGAYRIETVAGTLQDIRPTAERPFGTLANVAYEGGPGRTELPEAMEWCTYVGAAGDDAFHAVVLDAQSRPVMVGASFSDDFPTTPGAYSDTLSGGCDVVVTKLNADGTALEWSTYVGGLAGEWGFVIALDDLENPVVAGITVSNDFPTTPGAFDSTLSGGAGPDFDNFVTKLSEDGGSLLFSTYLGGNKEEAVRSLVVDPGGNVVVTGSTQSGAFPTTPGAFNETKPPFTVATFVTKLAAAGDVLIWSTFLASSSSSEGRDLALDEAGNVLVVGSTNSPDFPTTSGAYDETYNGSGDDDMYVTKLSADGSSLVWSTYAGSVGPDYAASVALDVAENPVVLGSTSSDAFPVTAEAFDETYNGNMDAVVLKLDESGSSLQWATYFGGSDTELVSGAFGRGTVALDATGSPVFAGTTGSPDLPMAWADVLGPVDASHNGGRDQFVARLSPDGRSLTWCTYLGGSGNDYVLTDGLALDPARTSAVVVGYCFSDDYPTSGGAFQPAYLGPGDGIVAKMTPPDATGVESLRPAFTGVVLYPCRPNPFRGATAIQYALPRATEATLTVHDVAGRLVRLLDSGPKEAGLHRVLWDARNEDGKLAAAGVYYYRLKAGEHREARSVLLLK